MINAHESGSNSPGAGTFSRDLTKTKSLRCRDFTWALHKEKSISPLFPGPRGESGSFRPRSSSPPRRFAPGRFAPRKKQPILLESM